MPFWKKDEPGAEKSKQKINYKARLEHKEYMDIGRPEPIYDLIDCGLKTVPSGLFSRCKVYRKEVLLLQENELSSFTGNFSDLVECLQVLDLHSNHLDKLSEDIGLLINLKVLNVGKNRLKRLPDSIGRLCSLQTLNASFNCLKELPASIGKLLQLKCLDISHNPKLKMLSANLRKAGALEDLVVDSENLSYPPTNVTTKGTVAIMKFLCQDNDDIYVSPAEFEAKLVSENGKNATNGLSNGGIIHSYDKIIQENLARLEISRDAKRLEMMALEEERQRAKARELELAIEKENEKAKLLADLAQDDERRDENVRKAQLNKDKEREDMFASINNVESKADAVISELLEFNAKLSDPQQILNDLEVDRLRMEDMLFIKAGESEKLREIEVKKAMKEMLEAEIHRENIRLQYERGKQGIVDNALDSVMTSDKFLEDFLVSNERQQKSIVSQLLENEKYQQEAFQRLLLKQDEKSLEISEAVQKVQNQLASLTMAEMANQDLKANLEMDLMAQKRETLSNMLVTLLDQKQDRAEELQKRLNEMESNRSEQHNNYWLIQYQKLMDSKPQALIDAENAVDGQLRELLVKAGAQEYLPIFTKNKITFKQLSYMQDKELSQFGVHQAEIRSNILRLADEFCNRELKPEEKVLPSAPTFKEEIQTSEFSPSAPPPQPTASFLSPECVICLERSCNILFLPCGHVCCCSRCESSLQQCPMCRVNVSQKVCLQ